MLRLRRREMMVSSTLLWQKLIRDREANAPWQKLRRNLLLFLQLLILAALVFALARPFIPVPSVFSGSVVVLLDSSASMLATDVEPTRFAVAKGELNRLINDLTGNSQMSIIQVGHSPTILIAATDDKNALRNAVDNAVAFPTEADWEAALALAAGAAQGFRDAQIIVVSDGGMPERLPSLPVEPSFVLVGESGENVAISALASRASEDGVELFASVTNQGVIEQELLFNLSLDGALFDSRRISVSAESTRNLTWTLPPETAVISARLSENDNDFLPIDDEAWTVHQGSQTNRALIVTEGNLFLEQVFGVLPEIEAFRAAPGSDLLNEPFDMLIFDGVPIPDPLPQTDMLIINPQVGSEDLFTLTTPFSNTVATQITDDPLMQFVEWQNVRVRNAQGVNAAWARPLVQAQGGPLILVGEQNGHRIAMLTFDLRDSDLPLQIAFPILMANITNWLSPGNAVDVENGVSTGAAVPIAPSADVTAVSILKPDGEQWFAELGEEALLFSDTNQPGLYELTLRSASGDRDGGNFAVNLFSTQESAIRPVETIVVGEVSVETAVEEGIGQREFWPWLVAIALLILLIEWWVHHRGTRLPSIFQTR